MGHISSKMVLAPGREFVRTQRRTCLRNCVEIPDIITNHLKKVTLEAFYWLRMMLAKGEACHSFLKNIPNNLVLGSPNDVLCVFPDCRLMSQAAEAHYKFQQDLSSANISRASIDGCPCNFKYNERFESMSYKCHQDILTHNANTFCFGFHHSLHED